MSEIEGSKCNHKRELGDCAIFFEMSLWTPEIRVNLRCTVLKKVDPKTALV